MKSNYIFKGKNVSIRQHWTGEYEIINSDTQEIIELVANQEIALKEYDRLNKE